MDKKIQDFHQLLNNILRKTPHKCTVDTNKEPAFRRPEHPTESEDPLLCLSEITSFFDNLLSLESKFKDRVGEPYTTVEHNNDITKTLDRRISDEDENAVCVTSYTQTDINAASISTTVYTPPLKLYFAISIENNELIYTKSTDFGPSSSSTATRLQF